MVRMNIARLASRVLPPLVAMRACSAIFPRDLAYTNDTPFVSRTVTGSSFRGKTRDFHEYSFAIHGFFDWRNIVVASTLCAKGDTIVEVGANVGTETISFLDLVGPNGKVVAFEPDPTLCTRLRDNLSLADTRRLDLRQQAASDTTGVQSFAKASHTTSSGTGHLIEPDNEERTSQTITVHTVRLDDALATETRISLLAMDVEGYEEACLLGSQQLIQEHRPSVMLEASQSATARAGRTLRDLLSLLRDSGYDVSRIGRFGLEPVSLGESTEENWIALHKTTAPPTRKIDDSIRLAGLLPLRLGFLKLA